MQALAGERVAFTGRLAACSRREACRRVRAAGGEPAAGVTRRTTLLVVGLLGWARLPAGAVSRKLREAEALRVAGHPIRVLAEPAFLAGPGARGDGPYDTRAVCRLLGVEAGTLALWEHLGLVRASAGRYDFRDVVSLRALRRLLEAGVRPAAIGASLERLARLVPGVERPLAQMRLVADGPSVLADLGGVRVGPDGQCRFAFERRPAKAVVAGTIAPEGPRAEAWFALGQTHEAAGAFADAAQAYREAIALDPGFAEAHFNLGNTLRETGDRSGAEAAFRGAVEADPGFALAWFNLADVEMDEGRLEPALETLAAALRADPACGDAHFNRAVCLERLGRPGDARAHWAAYLALEPRGPFADVARRRLAAGSGSRGST